MELEAKIDAKGLALDEGVHEEEPELFFRSEKKSKKSFVRQLWLRTKRSEIQSGRKQSYG